MPSRGITGYIQWGKILSKSFFFLLTKKIFLRCEIACWPLINFDNIFSYCIWKKTCPRDIIKQNPIHWLCTVFSTEWNYWQGNKICINVGKKKATPCIFLSWTLVISAVSLWQFTSKLVMCVTLCSDNEDIEIYTQIHMALKSSKKIRFTPNLFTLINVFFPFLFPKQISLENQLVP